MCFCLCFWLSTGSWGICSLSTICLVWNRDCGTCMGWVTWVVVVSVFIGHIGRMFMPICSVSRITLKKMPSIRETLQEMGVSVEQVLTELTQRSADDPGNGTVPTPLTNYLDVSLLSAGHEVCQATFLFATSHKNKTSVFGEISGVILCLGSNFAQ